jgi:hypothetical protein
VGQRQVAFVPVPHIRPIRVIGRMKAWERRVATASLRRAVMRIGWGGDRDSREAWRRSVREAFTMEGILNPFPIWWIVPLFTAFCLQLLALH